MLYHVVPSGQQYRKHTTVEAPFSRFETWRHSRLRRSAHGVQVIHKLLNNRRVIFLNCCLNLLRKGLGIISARHVTLRASIFVITSCFLQMCIIMHTRSQWVLFPAYVCQSDAVRYSLALSFGVCFT